MTSHLKSGKSLNISGDQTGWKAEFGKWSWISPEQIVELVACGSKTARIGILVLLAVDFNKHVYKEVMIVFAPYLQPQTESGKNPQKYIKYGAKDLERMLQRQAGNSQSL
ncbi:nudix hydrolase 26 [Quercus suber]|uniref:Nudix hydrolase 26 n=1 Tax=Quercus suber TaxID=58331 RepID=A0AAW0KCR5_QUESU